MPDISLMVSAHDNFSANLSKMGSASKTFQNQLKQLDTQLNLIDKERVKLKVSTDDAQKQLQEARKRFRETGDEMDRLAYEDAQINFDNLTRNLRLAEDSAKRTTKSMKDLKDEFNRQQNRSDGLLSQLGKAGMSQMLGNVASRAAGTFISSALGDISGDTLNSTISSAFSGAAIGSMIAPGIGTLIGAAGGAVVGALDGAIGVFEKKDDAFKATVEERYDAAKSALADSLSVGSEIAGSRETSMISWSTLLGSSRRAEQFTAEMRTMADRTPFVYDDLDSMAKTLKTYGYAQSELLPNLTAIGDAGAALGLNTSNMEMVATALGRMNTTDKASLEYLNLLTERGIGVVDWLAERDNLSAADVYAGISKGSYSGKDTAEYIIQRMAEEYAGSMEKQSKTFEGLTSTLAGAQDNLNAAMGEGFNSVRKGGMEEQINYLNGETGAKMQEAYSLIGEYQASLVNLQEQYQRDSMSAVMDGTLGIFEGTEVEGRLAEMAETYQRLLADAQAGSEEARAQMGALLAEAQVIAENEYMASTGYQTELEAQTNLINQIQSDSALNSTYYNTGLQFGQEFSKGLVSAINAGVSEASGAVQGISHLRGSRGRGKQNAWGQRRVPYDGYVTELHEGERVLTAQEARNAGDGGTSVSVQVMGNLVVREEADVDAVAAKLAAEIALARSVVI